MEQLAMVCYAMLPSLDHQYLQRDANCQSPGHASSSLLGRHRQQLPRLRAARCRGPRRAAGAVRAMCEPPASNRRCTKAEQHPTAGLAVDELSAQRDEVQHLRRVPSWISLHARFAVTQIATCSCASGSIAASAHTTKESIVPSRCDAPSLATRGCRFSPCAPSSL